MDTQKIMVTYVSEYNMKNEDGQQVDGCTVNYFFFGENGEMLKGMTNEKGAIGFQRAKCSIDISQRAQFPKVPGIYDASFIMAVGSDGKPVLKLSTIDFIGDVEMRLTNPIRKMDVEGKSK